MLLDRWGGSARPASRHAARIISNAVANAIGVRVPYLPLTPERVLEALEKQEGGRA